MMGKKKKDKPEYVIIEITYGDKKFIDCMKSVIRGKLAEK